MPFLPCFLCESNLEKRTSKNSKPYFVCDGCGIQLFVRGKFGIAKLERLFSQISQGTREFPRSSERFAQFRTLITEVDGLRAEIKRFDNEISFIFPDSELVRARDALQKRLNAVLAELEELAAANADKGKGK
jgi:hypothetical protein